MFPTHIGSAALLFSTSYFLILIIMKFRDRFRIKVHLEISVIYGRAVRSGDVNGGYFLSHSCASKISLCSPNILAKVWNVSTFCSSQNEFFFLINFFFGPTICCVARNEVYALRKKKRKEISGNESIDCGLCRGEEKIETRLREMIREIFSLVSQHIAEIMQNKYPENLHIIGIRKFRSV